MGAVPAMNYLIVLALIAISTVNAHPKPQNPDQQQQLSMQIEQRLRDAGFDVSKLPHDSNGNLDLSQLPRDSNGNIKLSQVVNGGGGSNGGGNDGESSGGGNINLSGGGNDGGSSGGGNINLSGGNIPSFINNLPNSGTININKIPNVQNGKLNLSPLGLDGTINLNLIAKKNGDIPILQLKLLLLRQIINKLPDSGTINVNQIPAINGNGILDLGKLPIGLNGRIDLSSIIQSNGDIPIPQLKQQIQLQINSMYPNANFNLIGKASMKGKPSIEETPSSGLNEDCGFYEKENAPGGSEEGRYGPGGQYGPHQLKPSETGGKYDAYDAQFKDRDAKIGITDIGEIVCNEPNGLQHAEGKILNGTQITLSRLTDKVRDLIIQILNKKAAKGGKKNIFGRAACEADKVLRVFFAELISGGREFTCGITHAIIKLLKALKSGKLLSGIVSTGEYLLGGMEQLYGEVFKGSGNTLKQALHGVGKIVDLKGKY